MKNDLNKKLIIISLSISMLLIIYRIFDFYKYSKMISEPTIAFVDNGYNKNKVKIDDGIHAYYENVIDNNENNRDDHGTMLISALYNYQSNLNIYNNFLMIKAFNNVNDIKVNNIAKGIKLACSKKVNILNLSFTLDNYDAQVAQEINNCLDNKVIVVASANKNIKDKLAFPASIKGVISVGAYSNEKDNLVQAHKDINLMINMDNAFYCLKDKCFNNNSNDLATAYASGLIYNKLKDGKWHDIKEYQNKSYIISYNYLWGVQSIPR